MAYNHIRNYFDFHGIRYGVGTVVKIKWEPYGSRREIERCGGVAKFVQGMDSGYLSFVGDPLEGYQPCNIAITTDPNERIEEIIIPVYYEYKPNWQVAMDNYKSTHPARRPDVSPGTILYIAAMIAGSIFKGNWMIWIIATCVYVKYLIDMYRD